MEKIITALRAQSLVSGSKERKQELVRLVNKEIESQAKEGHKWAHLPSETNEVEKQWLKDELTLNGFKINDNNPVINW